MKQKIWAVILKNTGKIFDTSSIHFTRRGTEQWRNNEIKKFADLPKNIYKIVRVEVIII
ncbi:MAG: hypothetical protein ABIJ17_01050 [Patescibacteria group bacterium]